jgi:hypothetical protein
VKYFIVSTLFLISNYSYALSSAHYNVIPGKFHKQGNVAVKVLPNKASYDVEMDFEVKKRLLVPVPEKLLKGSKVYQFPIKFKSKQGYVDLEKSKTIVTPKAVLNFVKRGNFGRLKDAYFIQVLPTNKKSKIDIIYHPSLASVGWARIKITFLSNIPLLHNYELEAEVDNYSSITGLSSSF